MAEDAPLIRLMVVDDEPLARQNVRRLLEHDPEVEIIAEAGGSDAPDLIASLRPDLVLLDVEMPELDGFEVLARVEPDALPLVIFITAHDTHALRAFERGAADYVLKPFTKVRLLEAMGRAKRVIRSRETEAAQRRLLQLLRARLHSRESPPDAGLPHASSGGAAVGPIPVRDGGRIILIRPDDIIWIEAAGSYARIHTDAGPELVRSTLGALEARLDPARFFRVHRSAIVAVDRLREVRHKSNGDYHVILRDGTELRLPRSRREDFELHIGLGS